MPAVLGAACLFDADGILRNQRTIEFFEHGGMPIAERPVRMLARNQGIMCDLETPGRKRTKPSRPRKRPRMVRDGACEETGGQWRGEAFQNDLRRTRNAMGQNVIGRAFACLA